MNVLLQELQEIEEDNKNQISEIIKQKKNAIKTLEYDEAEDLDNLIKEIKQQESEEKTKKILNYFEKEVENIRERSDNNAIALKLQNRQNEEKIRKMISISYQKLQKKHRIEISSLELEYEKQKTIESSRKVTKALNLLSQSQNEAMLGNYSRARELKAESENVTNSEIQKRLEILEQNYQNNLNKILDSSQKDLISLSAKLNDMLSQSKEQIGNQIEEEEKLFQNRILFFLQKMIQFAEQKCNIKDRSVLEVQFKERLEQTLQKLGLPPTISTQEKR